MAPLPGKILKFLTNHTKDIVALGITQNFTKSVLPANKQNIVNISAHIEETEKKIIQTENQKFQIKLTDISVHEKLKENRHFLEK